MARLNRIGRQTELLLSELEIEKDKVILSRGSNQFQIPFVPKEENEAKKD